MIHSLTTMLILVLLMTHDCYGYKKHYDPSEEKEIPVKVKLLGDLATPHPDSDIELGFVPKQVYYQVRRYDTKKRVPQSEAYKEASTAEEIINAPRLREVLTHKKTQEVYEEQGYEDAGYDHGGSARQKEETERLYGKDRAANHAEDGEEERPPDNRDSDEESSDSNNKDTYSDRINNKHGDSNGNNKDTYSDCINDKQIEINNKNRDTFSDRYANTNDCSNRRIYDDSNNNNKHTHGNGSKHNKSKKKKKNIYIRESNSDDDSSYRNTQGSYNNSNNNNDKRNTYGYIYNDNHENNNRKSKTNKNGKGNTYSSNRDNHNNANPDTYKNDPDTLSEMNSDEDLRRARPYGNIKEDVKDVANNENVKGHTRQVNEYQTRNAEKYLNRRNMSKKSSKKGGPRSKEIPSGEKVKQKISLKIDNLRKERKEKNPHEKQSSGKVVQKVNRRMGKGKSKLQKRNKQPIFDTKKYPFYNLLNANKYTKHSALKYAMNPKKIPVKVANEMSFYDSRKLQCDDVTGPVVETPNGEDKGPENSELKNPNRGKPRMGRLGESIDCFKRKFFGHDPLDNPFFNESLDP